MENKASGGIVYRYDKLQPFVLTGIPRQGSIVGKLTICFVTRLTPGETHEKAAVRAIQKEVGPLDLGPPKHLNFYPPQVRPCKLDVSPQMKVMGIRPIPGIIETLDVITVVFAHEHRGGNPRESAFISDPKFLPLHEITRRSEELAHDQKWMYKDFLSFLRDH